MASPLLEVYSVTVKHSILKWKRASRHLTTCFLCLYRVSTLRQGKRAEHRTQAILGEVMPAPTAATANTSPEPPAARQPETAAKPPISDLSDSEESVGALHGDEADDAGHEGAAPDGTCKATNSSGEISIKNTEIRNWQKLRNDGICWPPCRSSLCACKHVNNLYCYLSAL